jgi:succinyl-diaminopimelate desuccinylase
MSSITDKYIDEHFDSLVEDLQAMVRIPSVEAEAVPTSDNEPKKPFGENVRKAADLMLDLAGKKHGFKVKDGDGCYVIAEEGVLGSREMLGIICHLDVVPEGSGWEHPAFGAEIHDGKIVGRGTVDDKGPAMAALYALKAVRDCGYDLRRGVRLIFGLNEETGMRCIEEYLKNERPPDIAFTPDGSYPLCNSEFGICHAAFRKTYSSGISFNAGVAANVVPPEAFATVNGREYSEKGVQTHASTPWEGVNAAQKMINTLAALDDLGEEDKKVLAVLKKHLGTGYHGEGFGLYYEDETGKQTLNLGIVKWDEKGFEMVLDLRCPSAVRPETVKEKLTAAFSECGAELVSFNFSEGYYLSPDTEIVSKLMKVYQDRTGDKESKPIVMGGGTYARHLPNCVSFGPEGYMDVCSCHIPDEYITFDQLKFNTKMLADAILALACEE